MRNYRTSCCYWYWSAECWLQGFQEIPQSWVALQQMFWAWISWQQNWDLLPLIGKPSGILENVYVLHLLTISVGRWGLLFFFIAGTQTFTLHESNPWKNICQPYLKLHLFILPPLWRIFPLCVLSFQGLTWPSWVGRRADRLQCKKYDAVTHFYKMHLRTSDTKVCIRYTCLEPRSSTSFLLLPLILLYDNYYLWDSSIFIESLLLHAITVSCSYSLKFSPLITKNFL
jgi:hypothetical protein